MKIKLLIIFCLLNAASVTAQNKVNVLTGTYKLVAVDNILADGSRVHLYGDIPQGLLIFDLAGRYSLQIFGADRLKFAANDKAKGTDNENRAAIKGCNTHYGTYKIDSAAGTFTFNIEHASFPNWEGVQQKRPFTFKGNVFKYVVPLPTTGGAVTGEVVWEKME
jgi:hypothetical protein